MHLINKGGFSFSLTKITNNPKEFMFTVIAQMGKHADALTVYSQEYREVGTLNQYYYIDNNIENIWLLNIFEDEINRKVN